MGTTSSSLNWQLTDGACTVISSNQHEDWCVNVSQEIYHRVRGGGWQRKPGAAIYIDVASDGTCWCVNSMDQIYRWTGNNWTQMPGAAKTVGVGSARDVWVTNAAHQIYHCNGDGNWTLIDGHAKQISCGNDGTVMCCNRDDQIYRRSGVQGRWEQVDGSAKQIDVWNHSTFIVVNSGNQIYTRRNGTWVNEPGSCMHITCGGNNYERVVGCNSSHQIYHHNGQLSTPQPMTQPMTQQHYNQPTYGQSSYSQQPSSGISLNIGSSGITITSGSQMGGNNPCPSCTGKGGFGAFGYCDRSNVHYRSPCNTCNGSSYVNGYPQRCDPCRGKGYMGAFGACEPWSVHKRGPCHTCNGRGFRF